MSGKQRVNRHQSDGNIGQMISEKMIRSTFETSPQDDSKQRLIDSFVLKTKKRSIFSHLEPRDEKPEFTTPRNDRSPDQDYMIERRRAAVGPAQSNNSRLRITRHLGRLTLEQQAHLQKLCDEQSVKL